MAGALGEDTTHWITQNEPWVTTMLGHRDGVRARHHRRDYRDDCRPPSPGVTWPATEEIRGRVGREQGDRDRLPAGRPATDSDEDRAATRYYDGTRNRWFFDPVFGHGYPDDVMRVYQDRGRIGPEMIARAIWRRSRSRSTSTNYYTTVTIAAGGEEPAESGPPPGDDPPTGSHRHGVEGRP